MDGFRRKKNTIFRLPGGYDQKEGARGTKVNHSPGGGMYQSYFFSAQITRTTISRSLTDAEPNIDRRRHNSTHLGAPECCLESPGWLRHLWHNLCTTQALQPKRRVRRTCVTNQHTNRCRDSRAGLRENIVLFFLLW